MSIGRGTAGTTRSCDNRPVTVPIPTATRRQGVLLLADISGYTGFLQGVAEAHRALIVDTDDPPYAYAVMSSTLQGIVEALAPLFQIAKLEGDAVFAVADDGTVSGESTLGTLRDCYAAFRGRLATAAETWTCTCNACSTINSLDLKFIVHHGGYVAQTIAGYTELLGPEVNTAHRLLKNHAAQLVGRVPYALFTDAATDALSIATEGMADGEEAYDGNPPMAVHILVLTPAA
jgi:hypothetical protein